MTSEHKLAIRNSLEGFINCLTAETIKPNVREVITERAWHNRANWEDEDWEAWVTWGWYRHWARIVRVLEFSQWLFLVLICPSQYSPYLKSYTTTLETVLLDALPPAKSDPAVDLFRKTWNVATGQEV